MADGDEEGENATVGGEEKGAFGAGESDPRVAIFWGGGGTSD